MPDDDYVLKEVCDARHGGLDIQLKAFESAIGGLSKDLKGFAKDLRDTVIQRANDRAWALIGKLGLTLLAAIGTIFGIVRYLKG